MKGFVVVVVLAAVAAVAYFFLFSGSAYGVCADHPLGTFEAIDAYFSERDLHAQPLEYKLSRQLFGDDLADREDLTATEWVDCVPRYRHSVAVLRDPRGRVIAVGGRFRSSMLEFSTVGARSTAFMAKLWLEVAGGKPVFRDEQFASGAGMVRMRAKFQKGLLTGTWVKDWGGGLRLSHQVVDQVVFILD